MDQTTSSNQSHQEMIAKSDNNNANCRINKAKMLGSGSYGAVYLGYLKNQDGRSCEVAVKKIQIVEGSFDVEMHKKALKNQKKTFETVQKSSHVLKLYQYINYNNGTHYFIMEKCNEDFSKYWKKMEKDQTTIRYYFRQIILGYNEMFKQDIIHHDLKPENILVNSQNYQGILKIADFGLSQQKSQKFVRVNMTWQTTSPEVRFLEAYQETNFINHKSDMWSLGCILYWMIYNNYPYSQSSIKSDYKSKPIFPNISPELHNILYNLLQFSISERWDFPTLFSKTSSIHIQQFDQQFLSQISNLNPIKQNPTIQQYQQFFIQQQIPFKKLIKLFYQKTRAKVSLLQLIIQKLRLCPHHIILKKILIQSIKCLISLLYSNLKQNLTQQISEFTQQNDKNFINYFIIFSKQQIKKQLTNLVQQNNLKKKTHIQPWLLRENWYNLNLQNIIQKVRIQAINYIKLLIKIIQQQRRKQEYIFIHYLIILYEMEKMFERIEDEEDFWKKIWTWRKKTMYFRVNEEEINEYLRSLKQS